MTARVAQLQGVRQVVGDHDRRDVEAEHDLGQLPAGHRVEVRRRLVEDEDVGSHRQHRGQGDAPALAEAEVVRRPLGGVGHADRVQRLRGAGRQLVAAQAEVGRPEGDVVTDRGHEQLVVGVLEHDADAPADLGQVGLLDGQPGDRDASRGWPR